MEPCAAGRTGQCVQQQAAVKPIEWDGDSNPYTIGGNLSWANYTVSADALIRQAGSVLLIGRAGPQHSFGPAGINEYYLQLSNTGAWAIVRNTTGHTLTTLASGTVAAPGTSTWQHLALTFTGGSTVNGALIEEFTCNGGANQQWLAVNGELVNPASGKCLDDPGFNTAQGTQLDLWACNGGSNQQWSVP